MARKKKYPSPDAQGSRPGMFGQAEYVAKGTRGVHRTAALVTAIIGTNLLTSGNMTPFETVFWTVVAGLIVVFICWAVTPFGKPFRQALEDWLYKPDPQL